MVDKIAELRQKKIIIDQFRPLTDEAANNLLEWFKIELTYSSNALEGNTLTRLETAIVIQKGITIGGKLLKEHLEATNHYKAFEFILQLIDNNMITEQNILDIHHLVLKNIEEEYVGKYRKVPVRIAGSSVIFPNYAKVTRLMEEFIKKLNDQDDPIRKAMMAHYELVTIHPFVDGNGRTARLLMNLILMQNGYPPAIIKPSNRLKYLRALEHAQLGGSYDQYSDFMIYCISKSMELYIKSVKNEDIKKEVLDQNLKLIRIGELAQSTNETIGTIRYWIKLGLIEVADRTESGYQLFQKSEIDKCKEIRALQNKRFSLEEILIELCKNSSFQA